MRNEGNCNKLSFFNILSAVLIVCSFIVLQSAYWGSWDYAKKPAYSALYSVEDNSIVYDSAATESPYSKNTAYIKTHTEIKTLKKIQPINSRNIDYTSYARTYSGNERKQSILRATRKALAILQKCKRAIALEEDAMLPHHCSFIKLRKLAFSDDVGSICVNTVLHRNEWDVDSKEYDIGSQVEMAGTSMLFFIAIAYFYERFYYRQREAYPQSYHFYLVLSIHSSLLPLTHSGNKCHSPELQHHTHNVYLVHDNHSSIVLIAVVTLLHVFLPVTIAHTKSHYIITTMEVL